MELSSSDKERIQHQYDALAKKTLVGEAKSHRRTLAKRAAREVTFSDLSESELAQLFTTDEYESDYFRFQVSGFDVLVKNELLAEALNALPERKRDIVLLSYFLDMSDAEIGEQQTHHHHGGEVVVDAVHVLRHIGDRILIQQVLDGDLHHLHRTAGGGCLLIGGRCASKDDGEDNGHNDQNAEQVEGLRQLVAHDLDAVDKLEE